MKIPKLQVLGFAGVLQRKESSVNMGRLRSASSKPTTTAQELWTGLRAARDVYTPNPGPSVLSGDLLSIITKIRLVRHQVQAPRLPSVFQSHVPALQRKRFSLTSLVPYTGLHCFLQVKPEAASQHASFPSTNQHDLTQDNQPLTAKENCKQTK